MLKDGDCSQVSMNEISSLSPTGVVEALVVDDHANALAERLNGEKAYGGLFHFDAIELKAGPTLVDNACAAFRAVHESRKNYGFAFLGLRFGEADGMDLSGYQLLPILKRFFPRLPVIICSFHDEMGELARAFRNGAKWFLRKEELQDLPQVLDSLLARREWTPEWRMVKSLGLVEFKFEQARGSDSFAKHFDEKRQYLTYKCLERYPGRTISIRPMGGGLSGAATFKAVKATGHGLEPAQLPLVVKIDTLANTQTEYERFFRFIRPYIPNDAGRVVDAERVIDHQHAAIAYTFAGTDAGAGRLTDMRSIFVSKLCGDGGCDYKDVRPILDDLFDTILPRLHRVSPDTEMGELSFQTSYPNPELGEVSPTDFLGNWISRISVGRQIDNAVFERQSDMSPDKSLIGFEYFTSYDRNGHCAIEAYDCDKMTVVLSGPAVDEAVRGHSQGLRQGAMLWLDNNKFHYYGENENGRRKCLFPINCDESLPPLMEKPIAGYGNLPELVKCVYRLVASDSDGSRFSCPIGIVHGDLNYANIMVESRRRGRRHGGSDVWLIDFARTRRDCIAHDFATLFAATLDLVDCDLSILSVQAVFNARRCAVPDGRNDGRAEFIGAILRHIRRAAIAAGVSPDMFALSVALSLMLMFRIAFRHNGHYATAEGMLKAATAIIERLEASSNARNNMMFANNKSLMRGK